MRGDAGQDAVQVGAVEQGVVDEDRVEEGDGADGQDDVDFETGGCISRRVRGREAGFEGVGWLTWCR